MRASLPFLALLAVAGCVSAPKPVAPPRIVPLPRPTAAATAPLPADWRDWPLTAGEWRYSKQNAGSVAAFDGGVTVRCDVAAHAIELELPVTGIAAVTIRTSTTTRSLASHGVMEGMPPGDRPMLVGRLAASDPLLDAIAFSRGRWTIEQPGRPPLVLPAWAEVARVIEDCRG